MDIDTVVIRKYRCWMPEERAIEARQQRMPDAFIKAATEGLVVKVPRARKEDGIEDEKLWAEYARSQMSANMMTHRGQHSGTIYSHWFEVEYLGEL